MLKASIVLALVLVLDVVSALSVPFDPALVNSTHEVAESPCSYPRSPSSSLTLNRQSLTYVPTIVNDNRGPAVSGTWFCEGRVDLYYRHRPHHMRIEVIPETTVPVQRGSDGRPLFDQPPVCSEHQTKQVYWPWGTSRPGFVTEFKKMFAAAVAMKSSGPECLKKMGNLDATTSFLYTVAYDYFITV